jgi:hypothetical protein
MAVVMLIERYLSYLSRDLQERLKSMPLESVLQAMRDDLSLKSPLLADYDEYCLRSLAASFVVLAEKPHAYEDRLGQIESQGPGAVDAWKSLVQQYYTARVELMQRHHEISLYKRGSHEKGRDEASIPEPGDLHTILEELKPDDMLDSRSIEDVLTRFQQTEVELKAIRDSWIGLYLRVDSSPPELPQERVPPDLPDRNTG